MAGSGKTYNHTINIKTKTDSGDLGNLAKDLKTVVDAGEKAQNALGKLDLSIKIDAGDSVSELKGLSAEISKVAKDVKSIKSPKIELIDKGSSTAIKNLNSLSSASSNFNKSLKGISAANLEGVSGEVNNLTSALEGATSAASNLVDAMMGINGVDLSGAIGQANSLSTAFEGVSTNANRAAQNSKNIKTSGGNGSGGYGGRSSGGGGLSADGLLAVAAGKTAFDLTIANAATKETNKATMKTWGGDWQRAYTQIDDATNKSTVTMNATVPAMNAFKAATGANTKFLGDHAEVFTKLGTKVQALGYSEAEANNAMMDLAKGVHGAFASLDQYGLSEESVKAAGWSGKEDDLEGFMAAVDKVMGDTSAYENTLNYQIGQLKKDFSRGGAVLGNLENSVLSPLVKGFTEFDNALFKQFGFNIGTVVAGFSQLSSIIAMVGGTFESIKGGIDGIKSAWDAVKDFGSKVKDIPGSIKDKWDKWTGKKKDDDKKDKPSTPELPGGKDSPFDSSKCEDPCLDAFEKQKKSGMGGECDDDCCDDKCLDTAEKVGKQKKENGEITDKNRKNQGKGIPDSDEILALPEPESNLPDVYQDSDTSSHKSKNKGKNKGKNKSKKGRFGRFKDKLTGRFGRVKGKLGKLGKIGLGGIGSTVAGGIGASLFSRMGSNQEESDSQFDGNIIDMEKGKDGTYSQKKQGLFSKAKGKLGNLGKGAKGLLGKGKNLLSGIGGKLTGGLGKGLAKSGGGLLKGLGKGLGKGIGKLGGKLGAKLGASLIPGIGPILTAGMLAFDVMDMMGIDWFTPLAQGAGAVLDAMGPLGQGIKQVGGAAMDYLGGAADWFMGGFEQLMNGGNLGDIVWGGLKDIGANALNLVDMISPGLGEWLKGIDFGGIFSGIGDAFSLGLENLTGLLSGDLGLGDAFGKTFDFLNDKLGGAFDWLSGLDLGGIFGGIGDALGGAFEWLQGIDFSGILSAISPLGAAISGIMSLFSGEGGGLGDIFGGIGDALKGAFDWLSGFDFGSIFSGIASAASPLLSIFQQIGPLVSDAFSWLVSNGPGIWDGIVQGAQQLWDIICQVGDKVSEVLQGIQDFGSWIGDSIGGLLGSAGGILGGLGGLFGGSQETPGAVAGGGGDISSQMAEVDGMVAKLQGISGQIQGIMSSIATGVATTISNMVTTIGTSITSVLTQISTIITTTATQIGSVINQVITGVVAGITQISGLLTGMVGTVTMLGASFGMLTATSSMFFMTATSGLMLMGPLAFAAMAGFMALNTSILLASTSMAMLMGFSAATMAFMSGMAMSATLLATSLTIASTSMMSLQSSIIGAVAAFTGFGGIVVSELAIASGAIIGFTATAPGYMLSCGNNMKNNLRSGLSGISGAIASEMSNAYSVMASWGARLIALAAQIGAAIAAAFAQIGMGMGSPGKIHDSMVQELKYTKEAIQGSNKPLTDAAASLGSNVVSSYGDHTDLTSFQGPQVKTPIIKIPSMAKSNNSNSTNAPVINITVNGDIDSQNRINRLVHDMKKALFESKKAGRVV